MFKLYNSLSRKIESFEPANPPKVTMYTCGPTVYGPGHIGHGRTYVNFDLLKRGLTLFGFKVTQVVNITDIHDDMIRESQKRGVSIDDLAKKYIPLFRQDLELLNVLPADYYPRVSECIPEIIAMLEVLESKGLAYSAEDGSVYFKVANFKNYGKLSGRKLEAALAGTRVDTDKYSKDSPADFALWKAGKEGEPSWNSPWGEGRPGWHIECSVMAKKFLGASIDIHGGALDLKFPHHENEIAQSEAANGVPFAKYWVHGGLLEIDSTKMSQSLGNLYTLDDLAKKGFEPLDFRYLCLQTHYRKPLNFTWEALRAAQNALGRLRQIAASLASDSVTPSLLEDSRAKFETAIASDLNLPEALAVVWDLVGAANRGEVDKRQAASAILEFDKVLGLNLAVGKESLPKAVAALVAKREAARQNKDYELSDKLRREIEPLGYQIRDTAKGQEVLPV